MNRLTHVKAAAVVLGWSLAAAAGLRAPDCRAAAGDLDPTFGTGGKVETGFGHNAGATDAVLQPDGKLVVVGFMDDFNIATQVFHVTRYLPGGGIDPAFGSAGSVSFGFTTFLNRPNAVVLQADGKIIVAGEAESADGSLSEFVVARLNANGTLDASFGAGGKVMTDFFGPPPHPGGVREEAHVVLVQPDGKILVGGRAGRNPDVPVLTALARYNPDGSLDSGFGNGGLVAVRATGEINALALLQDGHILAVGGSERPVEFRSDGTLLPGATPGPIAVTAHSGTSMFQPDGLIPFIGADLDANENDLDVRVRRFNPTGGSDPTFTSPLFDFGGEDVLLNEPQGFCVTATDEIVVVGFSQISVSNMVFGVAVVGADGNLDTGFGNGGKVTTTFNNNEQAVVAVRQPDDKIIAIGETLNPSTSLYDYALARYLGPGTSAAPSPPAAALGSALEILENPAPAGDVRLRFELSGSDRVRAAIYDPSGRFVAVLADQIFTPGEHVLTWDGNDSSGRPAASGLYFTRVDSEHGVSGSRSVVLTR